ncbi:MAG: NAD(P)-dependent oxidoreductase [Gammaproteobacteria bacterium]|nr:MAG: NAD(P)-dependent oxidoreductase [Gammaproteobacteria bacterium]
MRRLLITGANGMLGSAVQQYLKDDFEIIAASRNELNIQDFASAKAYLKKLQPHLVLHAAAYTNVEEAERQPQECYSVNYNGTLNLINAAKGFSHKFIYISSTGNYGFGKTEPYAEYDEVMPPTVYHKSKYLGEKAVQELCADFLVLRTGWLFGGSTEHKKNFVYNRFIEAMSKDEMFSDPFQTGNPTNTSDVARQIKKLIDEEVVGTFNVVSEGNCTRYEYVKEIVSTYGLNCVVKPTDKPFERLAKVSPNEAAVNFNLTQMGLNVMPHWKDSLHHYINSIQQHA